MGLRSALEKITPHRGPAETRTRREIPALTVCWLRTLFGVALVMLVAIGAGIFMWTQKEEVDRLRRLEDVGEVVVGNLGNRVVSLQERLKQLEVDPNVRQVLLSGDLDAMRSKAQSLTPCIPGALRVRLVKLVSGGAQDLLTAPLSFAGLHLVKQAKERSDPTQVEVHRLGSPEEHLAIAAPILDEEDKAVLGVIHVALPISLLPSVKNAIGDSGYMAYQQWVDGKAVTLASMGGAAPSGAADHQMPIQGTSLQVAAWVDRDGILDSELLLRAGEVYLLLVVLVALVTWLPLRGLRPALASDFEGVIALVKDAITSKPVRRPQCRLVETEPVIEVLVGLLYRQHSGGEPEQVVAEGKLPLTLELAGIPNESKAKSPADQTEGGGIKAEDQIDSKTALRTKTIPSVPAEIFRTYDIRGIVDRDLTADLMFAIGFAVGTEAKEAGGQTVVVGRDTRPSGEKLSESLVEGLRKSGRDVLDLGVVPTPLVYFATRYQGRTSGVIVTASHNPVNYNGLKIVIEGITLAGVQLEGLRERILTGSFSQGEGSYQVGDLTTEYIGHVEKDVAIARTLKVIVDCGNGAASAVAPSLYRALGCDLVELDCNQKVGFPGGLVPDPTRPECLKALQQTVVSQGADIGLAFDSDGDRLGVVDSSGKIIWTDRVLMLLAADLLSRHPGTDVVFDVKSSHHLAAEIRRHGGWPVMWKSGYVPLKAKLQETGGLLAGEWSGHIIFQERWFGFDDALYAGARLLEVLAFDPRSSAEVFAALPEAIGTPELLLPLAEGRSGSIMKAVLAQSAELKGLNLRMEDGLRVESESGWGLVRASNTLPALVFRFEADDRTELSKIQDLFRRIMERAAPGLRLPF